MKVLSSASNSSDSSPTLWVWIDQELTASSHAVVPERIANDELVQQLPAGIRTLLLSLAEKNLLAIIEISRPVVPTSAPNQLRVLARPINRGASGHDRLRELVVTAERMTGHLRPTDDELLEVAASEGRPADSRPPEISGGDNLRLRWLLALQRLAEQG